MSAKTELQDTGERMIPDFHNRTIMYAEHMTRYIAAQKIAQDKVVLDIASGSGYGTKLLSEVAKKVYGVDVSEESVEYAKENYNSKNIEYLVGDAEKIPLPDGSVDLVVTFETVEHVNNYMKFIDEIHRVLKKDGLAIISTPNDEEFAEGNHFHLHEFKYKELTSLLGKTFKYLKPYHQATWAYAQISDDQFINTDKAVTNVEVHNFAPLTTEKYLYFYILCSNRVIGEKIDDIGGLGGHYSAREFGDIFQNYQKQIDDHKALRAREEDDHKKTLIKLKAKEREIHAITTSTSYKLARVLADSKQIAKNSIIRSKNMNPKRMRMMAKNKNHVKSVYSDKAFSAAIKVPATTNIAVVLHLYHTEMLPFFVKKLKNLSKVSYDLFITIPEGKEAVIDKIHEHLPDARIALVPNCGRDVLPFIQVAKQLENLGYDKILKIHSNKSPHRYFNANNKYT
jgi:ubiquinone/menaquinone biosynthesis C-methylase UbiE